MLIGIERSQLKGLEKDLVNLGFILDKETSLYGACRKVPGNTEEEWTWHYQFITTDTCEEKDFTKKMNLVGDVFDTWEDKLDAPITFNAGLCEDGRITMGVDIREKWIEKEWTGYNLKRGERSDAFKQYLRGRGLYFEPSEHGTYIHFEVKHADKYVDEFIDGLLFIKNTVAKEVTEDETNNDTTVEVKDSEHKLQDMNADQIVALIKEAGEKGRSWEWLKNKLPDTFLNLYNRETGYVFPMQLSTPRNGGGSREGVHLTKPTDMTERIDWKFLPEYLELKAEAETLLDKYGVTKIEDLEQAMRKAYDAEDSISKRLGIKRDLEMSREFRVLFDELVRKYKFVTQSSWETYNYKNMMSKDFVFDKKEYLKHMKNSYDNRQHIRNQKRFLVKSQQGHEITNLSEKVGKMTPEAEAYIRKILGETTTEEIEEKRRERYNSRYNRYNSKDPLDKYREDRKKLEELLNEVKKVENTGTFSGLTYEHERPKMIYQKGAGYDWKGNWVGFSKGDYKYAGNQRVPAQVSSRGYGKEKELFEEVTKALTLAMNSRTVSDLKVAIEEALEAVRKLPSDDEKIKEVKQKVEEFLKQKREEFKQRSLNRTKKLPDRAYRHKEEQYIYLFPEDLSKRDLKALSLYDLVYLGKNFFDGAMSYVVRGTKENLETYADDYLGYQLHPDYLYEEDEFAGEIV